MVRVFLQIFAGRKAAQGYRHTLTPIMKAMPLLAEWQRRDVQCMTLHCPEE